MARGKHHVYVDDTAWDGAKARDREDGLSLSRAVETWIWARWKAPKGLFRRLQRQAEDEGCHPGEVVLRALRRELGDPRPVAAEPGPERGEAADPKADGSDV